MKKFRLGSLAGAAAVSLGVIVGSALKDDESKTLVETVVEAPAEVVDIPANKGQTFLGRSPERVLRSPYGEKTSLFDFDGDGTFDALIWTGTSPGAYKIEVSEGWEKKVHNLSRVEASRFNQYAQ